MTLRMLLLLTTGLLLAATLASQTPYRSLPQDTIVVRPGFLNNIYLLDGKRLNLQVMQWFMTDHPAPYSNIRAAAVADQLAVAGYAVGGLIFLSGYLIRQQDPSTGKNLMRTGGLGLGAGLILTIASNGFQHKAVLLYNEDIRQTTEKSGWRMGIGQQGIVLQARF